MAKIRNPKTNADRIRSNIKKASGLKKIAMKKDPKYGTQQIKFGRVYPK